MTGRETPGRVTRRLVVLGLAGWFGGELVFVHGMGVKPPREASRPRPASSNRRIA
jgi:hypothetical protein